MNINYNKVNKALIIKAYNFYLTYKNYSFNIIYIHQIYVSRERKIKISINS